MGLTPFLGISGQSSTPFSSVFPPVPVLSLPRLPSQDAFLRSRSALKGTRPLVLLALFTAQEAALVCTLLRTQGADYDSALGFLKSLWNSSPMGCMGPNCRHRKGGREEKRRTFFPPAFCTDGASLGC